jgi:hypothetical protein
VARRLILSLGSTLLGVWEKLLASSPYPSKSDSSLSWASSESEPERGSRGLIDPAVMREAIWVRLKAIASVTVLGGCCEDRRSWSSYVDAVGCPSSSPSSRLTDTKADDAVMIAVAHEMVLL